MYIGIKDNPREIIGVDENERIVLEEKISNIIHDSCEPVILPEISFLSHEGKHVIKVLIYKGSNTPYHLKGKTIAESTFIRIGSSNRQASSDIIAELERQKLNKSFDGEISYHKDLYVLNFSSFINLFKVRTDELLSIQVLKKLELYKEEQGKLFPTNALVLLSDDELRKQQFPYAKIECARFKGMVPGYFIDQKSIDVNIT